MIPNRSIALCVVLTIITCGIYGWYWLYCLAQDIDTAANRPGDVSPALLVVLTIITCGIYGWIWAYQSAGKLNEAKALRGMPTDSNNNIIYLVLCILGFSIITWALMQNELNSMSNSGQSTQM